MRNCSNLFRRLSQKMLISISIVKPAKNLLPLFKRHRIFYPDIGCKTTFVNKLIQLPLSDNRKGSFSDKTRYINANT